jgi:hypothetical protein
MAVRVMSRVTHPQTPATYRHETAGIGDLLVTPQRAVSAGTPDWLPDGLVVRVAPQADAISSRLHHGARSSESGY